LNKIKKIIAGNFENFFYFYRHLRYRIIVAVVLSILVGILDGFGLAMFLPLLQMVSDAGSVDPTELGNLRFLIDFIQAIGFSLNLVTVLLFLCIFFLLKGVARFTSEAYRAIVQQFFIRKMRLIMVSALNRVSFKAFITSDAGRIQNTLSGEVERVVRAYQSYFRAFEQAVLVVVYMVLAFFIDAQFALLVSIGGLLTNVLYKQIYKYTKGASRIVTSESNVFQNLIIQHVSSFKYLKATALLHNFGEKLNQTIYKIEESNRKIGILKAVLNASREPLLTLVVSGVILLQIYVLEATLGPILISLLFFFRALGALMNLQNSWNNFLEVSGSMENMTDFQKELARNEEQVGSVSIHKFQKSIEMHQVSFKYGTKPILKNINLNIYKNQTVAFVGESGSGKTTLVSLLAGLMPTEKGQIIIDGINRNDLNISTYQQRIGYITQDPVTFNDTIYNNVTFWAPPTESNLQRYKIAIQKAAIHSFIETLPEKEQTIVGNNGINLSGGQKQRISIARELFKDIDILILDEATSALDSEIEKSIQENIDALKGEYTIFIVAHRLSTIKNADQIVMLKKGRIESVGSYTALVNQNSDFKRMIELQAL